MDGAQFQIVLIDETPKGESSYSKPSTDSAPIAAKPVAPVIESNTNSSAPTKEEPTTSNSIPRPSTSQSVNTSKPTAVKPVQPDERSKDVDRVQKGISVAAELTGLGGVARAITSTVEAIKIVTEGITAAKRLTSSATSKEGKHEIPSGHATPKDKDGDGIEDNPQSFDDTLAKALDELNANTKPEHLDRAADKIVSGFKQNKQTSDSSGHAQPLASKPVAPGATPGAPESDRPVDVLWKPEDDNPKPSRPDESVNRPSKPEGNKTSEVVAPKSNPTKQVDAQKQVDAPKKALTQSQPNWQSFKSVRRTASKRARTEFVKSIRPRVAKAIRNPIKTAKKLGSKVKSSLGGFAKRGAQSVSSGVTNLASKVVSNVGPVAARAAVGAVGAGTGATAAAGATAASAGAGAGAGVTAAGAGIGAAAAGTVALGPAGIAIAAVGAAAIGTAVGIKLLGDAAKSQADGLEKYSVAISKQRAETSVRRELRDIERANSKGESLAKIGSSYDKLEEAFTKAMDALMDPLLEALAVATPVLDAISLAITKTVETGELIKSQVDLAIALFEDYTSVFGDEAAEDAKVRKAWDQMNEATQKLVSFEKKKEQKFEDPLLGLLSNGWGQPGEIDEAQRQDFLRELKAL